jgi:hypothetical protein
MNNYIVDQNKFKLAGPPDWWLRKLWDFDSSLVVVPSRQDCVYRLAQRRKLNLPEHITNDALFKQSDTQMLATYSLIPVTTILSTTNWSNPLMWKELNDRAPHRLGGAEKVIEKIESAELSAEIKKNVEIDDMLTRVSKDAWKYYKTKLVK